MLLYGTQNLDLSRIHIIFILRNAEVAICMIFLNKEPMYSLHDRHTM